MGLTLYHKLVRTMLASVVVIENVWVDWMAVTEIAGHLSCGRATENK